MKINTRNPLFQQASPYVDPFWQGALLLMVIDSQKKGLIFIDFCEMSCDRKENERFEFVFAGREPNL